MSKISLFTNHHYTLNRLVTITFILLTIFFAINAFFNIGLFADGIFTFCSILQDLTWDDENRHFETFISHFVLISSLFCGLKNINVIIIIHGFWLYFSTLLLLFISYLLFPAKQKHLFLFTLLSYLITMNISSGFITSQIFISVGLYWLIIIPIIFEDFNIISNKKLLIMIISSFIMIKGYQFEIVFMIMFIIFGFNILKKVKNYKKYYILTFIVINLFALNYNICKYMFPLNNSYYNDKQKLILHSIINSDHLILFIIFVIFLLIILYYFIFNNKFKIKIFSITLIILLLYLLKANFINCLGDYRILNYFFSLLFSFIIYIIVKRKLIINIKYLKLLNFILLITFIFNMSIVNIKWNKTINNMLICLTQNHGFVKFPKNLNTSIHDSPQLKHLLSIIIQKQHGISVIKTVFSPMDYYMEKEMVFPDFRQYGIYYSKNFKFKYNNKFYSIYNFEFVPMLDFNFYHYYLK